MNSFRTNRELQSSLMLLAFALAYVMIAIRYPVDTLDNPGPGVFPRAVGVFLVSVTAWQVLRTFWALRRGDAGSAGTPAEAEAGSSGSSAGNSGRAPEDSHSPRLLKKVQMQGGAPGTRPPGWVQARGVLMGTSQRRASAGVPTAGGSPQMGLFQQHARPFLMIGLLVGYLLAIPWIGFYTCTGMLILAVSKLMNVPGWVRPLALALGILVCSYVLFQGWLKVPFPRGYLF